MCDGQVMTKISSAGEEIWCTGCKSILASATLEFKISGAGVEACSENGLPGLKGPGAEAKCYTYTPGNEEQQKRAEQKANQSAYMEEKRAHTAKLVESIAYFTEAPSKIVEGIEYTEEDKPKEASSPLERIIPATHETEDGVEVGGNEDVGSGKTMISSHLRFHPSIFEVNQDLAGLGTSYCTNCGNSHAQGEPCI